jgi:uncharacterized protein (TIGR02996 family)
VSGVSDEEKAFLRAIRAHPDDDGPRLVYADWLDERGDPRGEFIRVQCELAGLPAADPRREHLESRQAELLAAHRDAWEAPLRALGAAAIDFRRGLPETATISAGDFSRHAGELFALAPIRGLGVRGLGNENDVAALAESPHLANLATLYLWNNAIGDDGARALAESPYLANLTTLQLVGNGIGTAALDEILRTLARRGAQGRGADREGR